MKEIAKYPLILPPQSLKYPGRRILEDHFRKLGLDYHIIMESSNVELSSLYVEMGLGISFATVVSDLPHAGKKKTGLYPLESLFQTGLSRRDHEKR